MATSIGDFFSNFFTNLGKGLDALKDGIGTFFTNLGNSISGFFTNLWNNIFNFFKDLPGNISNIWHNFIELLQYINPWSDKFFLKIAFILSEDQEQVHTTNQESFRQAFNNKLPFVNTIVNIFQNAQIRHANVNVEKSFNSNPLNLSIGSFSYNGGAISYTTPSTDLSFILEKYEPYRVEVRNGLKLIIFGLGAVYLIKFILNYGITDSANLGIKSMSSNNKGGDD